MYPPRTIITHQFRKKKNNEITRNNNCTIVSQIIAISKPYFCRIILIKNDACRRKAGKINPFTFDVTARIAASCNFPALFLFLIN